MKEFKSSLRDLFESSSLRGDFHDWMAEPDLQVICEALDPHGNRIFIHRFISNG